MTIPDRQPQRDDSVTHPYSHEDRSSQNLYKIAAWLKWRVSGDDLSEDLFAIMTIEASECAALADLAAALENSVGDSLAEKMEDPEQRDALRRLSLRWLRLQSALITTATVALDRGSHSNGH